MKSRYTVKKNSDFRRMYSKGKSVVTPYMVVYTRKNSLPVTRTGYTVSAKLGNAVTRNTVRRRLREIYRLHSGLIRSGTDIIVVARSKAVSADYSVLSECFLDCCSRLGLLRPSEAEQ